MWYAVATASLPPKGMSTLSTAKEQQEGAIGWHEARMHNTKDVAQGLGAKGAWW